jgi:hypothetical protein
MSRCPGVHCPGCGKGGAGIGVLAVLAVLVIAALAVWRLAVKVGHAVEHGTDVLRHTTWEVIEWTAVVLGIAIGAAAVLTVLYVVSVSVHSRIKRHTEDGLPLVGCTIRPAVQAAHRLAIEAPRPALPLAVLAAFGHERTPAGRDHDEALVAERGDHLAGRGLGDPELLVNLDDARDHRAGR